jgi:aryl-alcohol dehydrogenase-like predicted oxidoreductase
MAPIRCHAARRRKAMDHRIVGRTGVRVSSLCMGTMSFGTIADADESRRMYAAARDAGIDFFDTADVYGRGRSEEILGRLIADERDDLVITSKVHGRMGAGVNDGGLSRRHVVRAVEASLRRLGTDRLDFYFVHQFDRSTHVEETLHALDDLVRRGLILYPAVSNWAAWQIALALGIAERRSWARFELAQPMYNLAKRQAEVEILPLAADQRIGVIPYSPLGGGLLTGKYAASDPGPDARLAVNPAYAKRYGDPMHHEVAGRLVAYASEVGTHPATLAVAWVRSHPAVTAPIIGARNLEQLRPSLAAGELDLDDEARAALTALTPPVPPAHDRTEELA